MRVGLDFDPLIPGTPVGRGLEPDPGRLIDRSGVVQNRRYGNKGRSGYAQGDGGGLQRRLPDNCFGLPPVEGVDQGLGAHLRRQGKGRQEAPKEAKSSSHGGMHQGVWNQCRAELPSKPLNSSCRTESTRPPRK